MCISKYIRAVFRRVFSVYHVILVKRTAGTQLKQTDSKCTVEIKRVTETMLTDTLVFESDRYEAIYGRMLEEKQAGFFGYLDGRCVYRSWVQLLDRLDFYGVYEMPLQRKSALFHYDFCAPEARGNGIHTEDIRQRCEQFFDFDCYATITPDNSSSMIGYMKNGFSKYKDVLVGRICFIPFHVIKDIEGTK